ncbi:YheC/YheD family protein [Brevibacillus sp. TJ4]|uniref:YheC/YheD family protein n=1 Tax=Brevibacillus sp. TJ4 TaxID=3234853 RepID=UPI0037D6865B
MARKSETKLTKYRIMRSSASIAKGLPLTRSFSRRSFSAMVRSYPRVFAKPISGSGGAGIIMISRAGANRFHVHSGAVRRTIRGSDNTYRYVKRKLSTHYLLQQGIPLARVGNRPFDVRVMVQRKTGSSWIVTGMLAKVAGRGYIITNIRRSGGYVLPLSTAIMRSNIRPLAPSAIISRLSTVALLAAERLSTYYRSQRVYGFDMGIDRNGRVWIIEANLRPDISLFLKLPDKSMYQTILSYRS